MSGTNPSNSPWNVTSGVTALATTVSTQIVDAVAAARHFVTGIELWNNSAVTTFVSLLDDTTVIWTGVLPAVSATQPLVPVIATGLDGIVGTPNKKLNIKCATVSAALTYNIQGYDAP
jgi:hypothetical protein